MKLPRINGGTWSLEADRGKVVLLNFWATWCPPCRMETPGLVSIHNRFVNQGFSVVGVSLDDDPKAVVPEFARKYGVPYPMVVPASGFGLSDGIESLPTSLLIDRHGKVAKTYIGMVTESALSHDVEELLKEAGR